MSINFQEVAPSINISDDASIQDIDPLSGSAWINPGGWGGLNYGRIFSKETGAAGGWLFFLSNAGSTNGIQTLAFLRHRLVQTNFRGLDYAIPLDEVTHVGFTYESTQTKLFINGVSVSAKTYAAGSGAVNTDVGTDFKIGNRGAGDRGFDGMIEDSRLYGRVLSEEEMMAIYIGKGHDQIVEGLVGRWPLTEKAPGIATSTNAIRDVSLNKNDGLSSDISTEYGDGVIAMRRTA